MNDQQGEFVTLGKIIGFFGVRGWVKVFSDTDPRENIVSYKRWWLGSDKQRQPIELKSGKRSGKNVIAQLVGIDTRELAEPLIGKEIAVLRSDMPSLASNEVYWTDLVGCEVVDLNGTVFGRVDRLFDTGANDVMVVRDARGDTNKRGEDLLIPWIRLTVVKEVDLTNKRILVDWDPELIA